MELLFPEGPNGACHPLNVRGFSLERPECAALYQGRGELWNGWEYSVRQLARLAAEGWNCTSVQECALNELFINLGSLTTPGFWGYRQPPVQHDHWRVRFWEGLALRARRAHRRQLKGAYAEHAAAFKEAEAVNEPRPLPSQVTLGVHADPKSAAGPWKGQLEVWKAYASVHGWRWHADDTPYFDGTLFAKFFGLYWASTDAAHAGFERQFQYLIPMPGRMEIPTASFVIASARSAALRGGLVVFTQPPKYWDSLEALHAVLPLNSWTIWIDYDFTMSPCCFEEFSLRDLIQPDGDGHLPHVIVRDSPREDYHHHCANAGFFIIRNSPIGRLFVDLAQQKRQWPGLPYGYQAALAESLLELLGMERGWRAKGASGKPAYASTCLPLMATAGPMGHMSYANFCQCYRKELKRLAGPEGARTSRWVHFVSPGFEAAGPEPGMLLASLFIYRGAGRGIGVLPLTTWSRDQHRAYMDAWIPPDADLGGPCAFMPLMIHWASVPFRPRLIYEFLNARFPKDLPMHVLVNGTAEELARAYRSAGLWGNSVWRNFVEQPRAQKLLESWGHNTSAPPRSGCNFGTTRMWKTGGFARNGRSTQPYDPR
mmetsp:Transcript_25903/g.72873  ORF Transcript_25903/g.72873 Transcript_25903/m.72873 type:complete len:599 (+) Transcript_25903:227-2023(+)